MLKPVILARPGEIPKKIHLGEMWLILNMMPFKEWEELVALDFFHSILNCTVFYGVFVSVFLGVDA